MASALIAGTALSAYGSYRQGREAQRSYEFQSQIERARSAAEARNLEYQAEIDKFNAEMAEEEAQSAMFAASLQEDLQRRTARQVLASQRAALIQSGAVDTFAGQALVEQSAVDAEADALAIRYRGIFEKNTLLQEADNLRRQAEMDLYNAQVTRKVGTAGAANLIASGRAARRAGTLGAAATLLGGYGKYKQAKE